MVGGNWFDLEDVDCFAPVRAPAYDIDPTFIVGVCWTGKLLARAGKEGFYGNKISSEIVYKVMHFLIVEKIEVNW